MVNVMSLFKFFILFLAAASTSLQIMAATFTATVDRRELSAYETLELTLRTDTSTESTPSLEPLNKDFEVISTRQSRQLQIINGRSESWQDWVITLAPRREGQLIIPSLSLENLSSSSITIQVNKENRSDSGGRTDSPIFIDAEVNKETVYVQEEVTLTLKIFYRVNLYDESNLTPLEVDGALVQKQGEVLKYDTNVEGVRYGVFELKYAIYPQRAGAVEIPSLTFTGTMAERRDPFSSIFSRGGRPISVRSTPLSLAVEPQPGSFTGPVWLPARNLSLTEKWSTAPNNLQVGDPVTRTITLEADGISSAQLPALWITSPDGVKSYPDQSKTEDISTQDGITGRRTEAIAMVPTQAGTIQLPAIRYHWYDTENSVEKVAELPARAIQVLPNDSTPETTIPVQEPVPASEPSLPQQPEVTGTESKGSSSAGFWPWLSAILVLLWLGTVAFLRKPRKSPGPTTQPITAPTEKTNKLNSSQKSEVSTFKTFETALQSGDINQVKSAFIHWSQALLQDKSLTTVDSCLEKIDSESLKQLFSRMEAAIYSPTKGDIPIEEIIELCQSLRLEKARKKPTSSLPELYPK